MACINFKTSEHMPVERIRPSLDKGPAYVKVIGIDDQLRWGKVPGDVMAWTYKFIDGKRFWVVVDSDGWKFKARWVDGTVTSVVMEEVGVSLKSVRFNA